MAEDVPHAVGLFARLASAAQVNRQRHRAAADQFFDLATHFRLGGFTVLMDVKNRAALRPGAIGNKQQRGNCGVAPYEEFLDAVAVTSNLAGRSRAWAAGGPFKSGQPPDLGANLRL